MRQISKSLFDLCCKIGVKFHFNKSVDRIVVENGKALGIVVDNNFLEYDRVVSNVDINLTYSKLLNRKLYLKIEIICQAQLLYFFGVSTKSLRTLIFIIYSSQIITGKNLRIFFEMNDIYHDPTIYINITSKDIKNVSLLVKGCENWFIMINSPKDNGQDWNKLKNNLRENIIKKLIRTSM